MFVALNIQSTYDDLLRYQTTLKQDLTFGVQEKIVNVSGCRDVWSNSGANDFLLSFISNVTVPPTAEHIMS